MLRKIYLSPLGILISSAMNLLTFLSRPFMVYGYFDRPTRTFRKFSRVSSSAVIGDKRNVHIGDHVWIWHHSILDGSNGIKIGRGSQVGAWVGIFSHSSHMAIRLYGERYITVPREDRIGYSRGAVEIGEYCFVGAGALIMPGVTLGKGCLVTAGALVTRSAPDYSILRGSPAKVVGDVRDLDREYLDNTEFQQSYFDQDVVKEFLRKASAGRA
jgi:acetyltransferase-like isoleucine patch superfamily enzyme